MDFKEIPQTWLACIFIGLVGLITFFDLNGFAHTMTGVIVGYFFHKAKTLDERRTNSFNQEDYTGNY